jgi:hypothetical protein
MPLRKFCNLWTGIRTFSVNVGVASALRSLETVADPLKMSVNANASAFVDLKSRNCCYDSWDQGKYSVMLITFWAVK